MSGLLNIYIYLNVYVVVENIDKFLGNSFYIRMEWFLYYDVKWKV